MACLPPFPDAPVFAYDAPVSAGPPCAAAALDIAARGAVTLPSEGISRTLDLARARLGLGIASGPVWTRLRVAATRSADDDSYVGIAGEAYVPVFEQAAVGGTFHGFYAEVGLVPDPWVVEGNRAWGLDAVVPTFAEELEWIAPSDAGGAAGWEGAGGRLRVQATLVTGEGANRRERNEGKDVAGTVSAAPLGNSAVVVTLYGRDGSRGLGYAPAHRLGARVSGEVPRFAWGIEAMQAWGVGTDATRTPEAASAWVRAEPVGPLLLAVRGDGWTERMENAEAGAWRGSVGAGVTDEVPGGRVMALLGADHVVLGEGVAPFAGSPAGASTTTLFVQVQVQLGVDVPMGTPVR